MVWPGDWPARCAAGQSAQFNIDLRRQFFGRPGVAPARSACSHAVTPSLRTGCSGVAGCSKISESGISEVACSINVVCGESGPWELQFHLMAGIGPEPTGSATANYAGFRNPNVRRIQGGR